MLKDNIKAVQKEGGKVTLYFQGHLIDVTTDYYKMACQNYESKSLWGVPYYEQYNKSHDSSFLKKIIPLKLLQLPVLLCPEWQQLMEEKTDFIASFGGWSII